MLSVVFVFFPPMKHFLPILLSMFCLLTACRENSAPIGAVTSPSPRSNDGGVPAAAPLAVGVWTDDYDAALALAAEKRLPVFLNFTGSDWCPFCKLMNQQVFSTPEWNDYATNSLVLVLLDFPHDTTLLPEATLDRNHALAEHYGINSVPTYILLGPDGAEIGQLGATPTATPASFIAALRRLTAK